jgi:hypothetical protein
MPSRLGRPVTHWLVRDRDDRIETASTKKPIDGQFFGGSQTVFNGGDEMNAIKITGIVLIVAGILGLMYGGFSYTKETHGAKLGPIELKITEKETINVPIWAGVGAIVIGGVLLLMGGKKG